MVKAERKEIPETTDCEGTQICVGDIIEVENKKFSSVATYKGLEGKIKRIASYVQGEKVWVMITFRSRQGFIFIEERSSLKKVTPKALISAPIVPIICKNNQIAFF